MKRFSTGAISFLLVILASCGNNTQNSKRVSDLKQTDATIQREIYGLTLGNTYTESELFDVLSQKVTELTNSNSWIDIDKPHLRHSEEEYYKYYRVEDKGLFEGKSDSEMETGIAWN